MNIKELIEKARLTDEEINKAVPFDDFNPRVVWDDVALRPYKIVAQKAQAAVWNLVVKKAGVCPSCDGTGGWMPKYYDMTPDFSRCEACHGTGKTEPKTVRDILEEATQ